jgi:predicted lipid-binding transport protein (Tim44 family)
MVWVDILVLAVISAIILFRLRGVLGKQVGHMPQEQAPVADPKMVEYYQDRARALIDSVEDDLTAVEGKPDLESAVQSLKEVDPTFSVKGFLKGAQLAFEMILDAYKKGDKDTLATLLSPVLRARFAAEIDARAGAERITETTLLSITSADMVSAQVERKLARITVRFVSEQVSVVRDGSGALVEGDPTDAESVEDVWVFERSVSASDPNWQLVDVQDE